MGNYTVRGLTELNKEMFYTAKGGKFWVSTEQSAAKVYESFDDASHRALVLNRTSSLYGIRFTTAALSSDSATDVRIVGQQ